MEKLLAWGFIITLFMTGCKDENNPIPPSCDENRQPFVLNFTDYAENNYFLDKVYADTSEGLNIFNKYYGNPVPFTVPEYRVKQLEVYKVRYGIVEDNSIAAFAFIDLPPRNSSTLYTDSLRYFPYGIPGKVESAYFKLLSEGNDYIFHPETGYITFTSDPIDNDIIAAAYKIEGATTSIADDITYGEFWAELVNSGTTRGVLKLIRPRNLQPAFTDAWKLKLKNIYRMADYVDWVYEPDLNIYLKSNDGSEVNNISGTSFLQLFGLDRLNESRNEIPDGKFDVRPNITYLPNTAEIIFPVLEPFGRNLPGSLNDSLKFLAMYDTTKTALGEPKGDFILKGSFIAR